MLRIMLFSPENNHAKEKNSLTTFRYQISKNRDQRKEYPLSFALWWGFTAKLPIAYYYNIQSRLWYIEFWDRFYSAWNILSRMNQKSPTCLSSLDLPTELIVHIFTFWTQSLCFALWWWHSLASLSSEDSIWRARFYTGFLNSHMVKKYLKSGSIKNCYRYLCGWSESTSPSDEERDKRLGWEALSMKNAK
jgi:hypothetical protein